MRITHKKTIGTYPNGSKTGQMRRKVSVTQSALAAKSRSETVAGLKQEHGRYGDTRRKTELSVVSECVSSGQNTTGSGRRHAKMLA
jgi:hypothetical protein